VTHLRCLYAGRDPARALAIADLRAMALRRLPGFVAEFLEGGAEDENTLAANLASFAQARFAPRVLTGPPPPSGIRLFGQDLPLPLVIAPTGFNALHWHEGDLALGRAAARAGVPFTQSTVSNATIEQVATTGARHWFQLYAFRDRGASAALVERASGRGGGAGHHRRRAALRQARLEHPALSRRGCAALARDAGRRAPSALDGAGLGERHAWFRQSLSLPAAGAERLAAFGALGAQGHRPRARLVDPGLGAPALERAADRQGHRSSRGCRARPKAPMASCCRTMAGGSSMARCPRSIWWRRCATGWAMAPRF
jgi:(S)-mandelate dehydrogenase